jgi:hypothetical protein
MSTTGTSKNGVLQMNNQTCTADAYVHGLSQLVKFYRQNGFQSFISSTPDMLTPIESPESLYPGLTEFPNEIFTQLIIADLLFRNKPELEISSTLIREIKKFQRNDGIFNFFYDDTLLPADIDCTAIGQSLLIEMGKGDLHIAHQVVDRILDTANEDGIVEVYFSPCGHRHYVDPVVGVNALYLIALLGREKEARKTEAYVFEYLRTQAYSEGTRYYPSPDIFLYFLARLIDTFPYFRTRYEKKLKEALQTRLGSSNSPLDLAARVITAKVLGISNDLEEHRLVLMQNKSQGWKAGAFFKFGTRRGFFGCNALTTAFATKALETLSFYEQYLLQHDYIPNYQPFFDKKRPEQIINIHTKNNDATAEQAPLLF